MRPGGLAVSSLSTVTDQNPQTDRLANRSTGWLLALMAGAGPLVVDPFGWDHFGPLRLLILAGLGFWAIAGSVDAGLPDRTPLPRLWVAFLVWGALCAVLAADRLYAWIGTPDRRFGWLTWVLCGGVFLVARLQGPIGRRRIVRGFAVGAVGLGGYTTLEWLGSQLGSGPLWPAIDVAFAGGRAGGPFGQPAFLGAAAVLVLPIAAGLAADRSEGSGWRVVGGVGAVTSLLAVLASQSRAAWVGFVVAAGLFLVLVLVVSRRGARTASLRSSQSTGEQPPSNGQAPTRLPAKATAAALVIFALVVLLVPELRRRFTGAFGENGVLAGRTDEWRVGLRALADAPVFGYGPEGYRTVFWANVDDRYVLRWGWEVITDRAHNGLLDVALIFGVPGALLFAAMVVYAARAGVAALWSDDPTAVGLGVGVIGSVVQQQFLFPLSEVEPLLWLAIGLLPALAPDRSKPSAELRNAPRSGSRLGVLQPVAAGAAIGLAVVVTIAAALDVAANIRLGQATETETAVDPVDAEPVDEPLSTPGSINAAALAEAAEAAATLRPDSIRYLFVAARAARQIGDLPLALEHIETGLDRSPADPALRGEQARLLLEIARAMPPGSDQATAIGVARAALESVVEDAPLHPEHLQRLGVARALNGDLDAAIVVMEEAVRLAPDRPEPQQNLDELRRLAAEG